MKKIALLLLVVLAWTGAGAQTGVLDGVYVKEHTPERKVISYTHLREADVMWSKRIWRVIDLREKINHPLYFPTERINNRRSLIQVIEDGIKEGTITAYDATDDEFKVALTKADAIAKMSPPPDTVYIENPETGVPEPKVINNDFNPERVKKFRIKEDWFFDKQKSVLECRIIGMCPMMEDQNPEKPDKPLFWVYFPEARYTFVNAEVFNRMNDAERRTMEDIFWKRMFGSYIYKEQNVFDRRISEYATGIDALLESERIKEEIFLLEHDLWEF